MKLLLTILILFTSLSLAQKNELYDIKQNGFKKSAASYTTYEYNTISNHQFELTLLRDGFFTIGTNNGNSSSVLDDNCQITFGHPFAKTSFPSLEIDGEPKEYYELFTELNSVTSLSSSRSLGLSNRNDQIEIYFTVTINDSSDQIIITQTINNIDTVSHSIIPKITFDPALGKYGDGVIPLSGSFLINESTFSPNDLIGPLTIFEKNSGSFGMEIEFEYGNVKPEIITAKNWISNNSEEFELETLYDLLLEFEWEEITLDSNETYTSELIIKILEPQFNDILARWDFPSFILLNDGLMFPNDFDSYLELYKSGTLSNEEYSFHFNLPSSIITNEPYSVTFNNSTNQVVKIPVNTKIIYENRVDEIGIQILKNGEIIEEIKRKIFIPSTPLSDTGLEVVIDSSNIEEFPKIDLIFHTILEESGAYLTSYTKDNIFLYENEERITEYELSRDTTNGVNSADIIFVLDVTGSMGNEIDGVKNNIQDFANELSKKGIDYRFGMVTFLDVIENVYPFTKDVQLFHSYVENQYAHGGGDGPENSLDALWKATEFPFRPNSKKIVIWITDINYHETDWASKRNKTEVANKLVTDGFTVHAIGNSGYKSTYYDPIIIPTGGNFYDISGQFKDIMLDITNMRYSYKYLLSYVSDSEFLQNTVTIELHHAGLGGKTSINFSSNPESSNNNDNTLSFYPNPFNPEINFNIAHQNYSDGIIRIYNVLGQEVNKINFTKGEANSLKWNAQNQMNMSVGTGLYLVQLSLKDNGNIIHQESAKILYLK